MSLTRLGLAASGALVALALGIGAASAASAYASSTVNVRAGAGIGYPVVDVLRRGDRVEVTRCVGTWCFVQKPGADGWVSANYLSAGGGYDDDYYDDYYDDYDDGFYIRPRPYRPYVRSQVCLGGPMASFCFRD